MGDKELIARGREFVRSTEHAGGKHLVSGLCDALEAHAEQEPDQTTNHEICGAELNTDSRPCQSERGHSGNHWTPSDQADKPAWWSATDVEVGSHDA